MTSEPLQFGQRRPDVSYADRLCVYGILLDNRGLLAVAEIAGDHGTEYDLPGGGVEAGESDLVALVREFREEVGLTVRPERLVLKANQFWNRQGIRPRNSLCAFWLVEADGEAIRPLEPDHKLVWLEPLEAARRMRHDAHAWAILRFVRAMS
jgi:8-oxo-dGTP diphosphatase